MSRSRKARLPRALLAATLVVLVSGSFIGVIRNGFIELDDAAYLTSNPHLRGGLTWSAVGWAFTALYASNWHPVTWLSHALDVTLFGLAPAGHHGVSLGIHTTTAVLLALVLEQATGARWRSWFVAAFFAVHPLRVESVAWGAERKDVLAGFFWVLSLAAYLFWVRRPSFRRYALLLAAFTLGLLSKPMLVTLPAVLLLLDYWPLGRIGPASGCWQTRTSWTAVLSEKAPLFILAAVAGFITLIAQWREGALGFLEKLPLGVRLANACLSTLIYLGKTLWPQDLSTFYRYAHTDWHAVSPYVSLIVLAGISSVSVLTLKSRPFLLTGWSWYLVTLLPVSGIVQVGGQAMADRYTYLPLLGPTIAVTWFIADSLGSSRWRRFLAPALATATLVVLLPLTRSQVERWRDGESLARAILRVDPDNHVVRNMLGTALLSQGRLEEAERSLREALRLMPEYSEAAYNLGLALLGLKRYGEAAVRFGEVAARYPNDGEAWFNLGFSLARTGRTQGAMEALARAAQLNPEQLKVHREYARALVKAGMPDLALTELKDFAAGHPQEGPPLLEVGLLLAAMGRPGEARAWLDRAAVLGAFPAGADREWQ